MMQPQNPAIMPTEPSIAFFNAFIGQPISAIPPTALPESYRILPPNGMMTMDYRPDRVNFFVATTDKDAIIKSITQG
ncbi:hypothetical protein HDU98_000829 [Podochytrium sp. JEL0797]|nr:hypothetical protein HDU98_000829 [Podochytrium sp. JEL0797]